MSKKNQLDALEQVREMVILNDKFQKQLKAKRGDDEPFYEPYRHFDPFVERDRPEEEKERE